MDDSDLLERLAATLRTEIGPAVDQTYARTQTFMAAVILERLARRQRLGATHAAAERADRQTLVHDLEALVAALPGTPAPVRTAVASLGDGGEGQLADLVQALWVARDDLDDAFDVLLDRVRGTLRSRLDRQLEVAI